MGNPLRLLIIDASDVETELLVSELRRAYEVEYERVETKETLQAALREDHWDLILGTYSLPGLNARQAVDVLAARRLDLAFLLIPSPIHERAVIAALKAGSNDFLVKGTFADLVSIIEQEMREAKKRRERGRAEKPGEELFGSAFQLSPVGICITGLDGTLLNTSQSLADMLGFTRAELEGKHFSDITYPADLDIGREAVGKMMSGQVPSVSFEKRYLHRSGEPIWALVSSSLLRDSSGQPVHFITHILNITGRQQQQEQLKFFGSIVESANDAIIGKTSDGIVVSWNQGAERLYGYRAEEMIGRSLSVLLPPDRPDELASILESVKKGQRLEHYETVRMTKDGQQISVSLNVSPILDNEGQVVGASAIGHDITERKQVEEALSESQSRLASIIDSAMDAIITIDEQQRITLFNPAAEHIFGYSAAEVIGAPLERLLPERFRSIHQRHVRFFGATEITRRTMGTLGVLHGLRADGEEFPLEASISQLESAGQKFYTVILRDISERLQAQEYALESEARYQRVLDAMMEGCQIIDFDWRYVYVNDVVASQGKNSRDQLLNRTMMEVYPGIENTELFAALRQCMQDRRPTRLENQFLFPDGSIGWFELSIQPAREGIFILSTDITERKRAEEAFMRSTEELRRSNTELEQFAYVSSHDLQEPLRMVSSYVQLLAKRYRGQLDSDADEFIAFAVEGATRMQQLINDLLAYSRVGTQGKPFAPTNFGEVLENALDNLQIAIQESEAVVTHDPLPTLMADHVQMVQLFQNLIGNAIKFRDQAPRIHVHADRIERDWQFSVRDNGVGIDPQFAERIFIIFQRLHTRAEYAGTGIGLAICKKIVERHGGRIWVEPVPEQGSIFHFTIPDTGGQHDDKT